MRDHPHATVVRALVRRGEHVLLVRRARGDTMAGRLELPGGKADAGESHRRALARELREETGLRAGRLQHLGRLDQAPGFCSQGLDVWLATALVAGPPQREASEQDMRSRRVSDGELRRMVQAGELVDAASLAAYALCMLRA